MKKLYSATLCILVLLGLAQPLAAKDLLYFVDMCSFYDAEGNPYVEVYLDVDVRSIALMAGDGGEFQGAVEIRLEIEGKDSTGQYVYERDFDLLSPPLRDTSTAATSFGIMDVRRISLAPGNYVLTGHLRDKHLEGARQHKFVREFYVEAQPAEEMSLSEIEFVQSVLPTTTPQALSKHGYDIAPLVNNGTYVAADSLHFYVETYHADRETQSVYFVSAYITVANSGSKMRQYQRTFRQTAKALDLIKGSFHIGGLPSGTYYMNIDVYSQDQSLVANTSKKFFIVNETTPSEVAVSPEAFRENFDLTEEQLDYYIRTLQHISTPTERDFVKALENVTQKQNYFFNFWEKRKERPTDPPAKPWTAYKSRVDYSNQHFKAAHLEGWRTDMGRVMCTYGAPNDIEQFPSSNTYHPYQIWRYNKLKTQANVRFIFYNPNEATNELILLHSDLRGERNNPRYEFDLVRTAADGNLDVQDLKGNQR